MQTTINKKSRLSEFDVIEIRTNFWHGGMKIAQLAKDFDTSYSVIWKLLNGDTYKDVNLKTN